MTAPNQQCDLDQTEPGDSGALMEKARPEPRAQAAGGVVPPHLRVQGDGRGQAHEHRREDYAVA